MNNRPHGNELLTVARRVLLDDLLPLLPADKTYDVLMIAHAMAIAARELQHHGAHDGQSSQAIAQFSRQASLPQPDADTEQGLPPPTRHHAEPPEQEERPGARWMSFPCTYVGSV